MNIKKLLKEYGVSGLEEGDISAIERMIEDNFIPEPDWISVEDQAPNPLEDVIFYDKKRGVEAGFLGQVTKEFISFRDEDCLENVTHWMRMPRCPKKK